MADNEALKGIMMFGNVGQTLMSGRGEPNGAGGRTYSMYVRWQRQVICCVSSVNPIRSTVHSPVSPIIPAAVNKDTSVRWAEWIYVMLIIPPTNSKERENTVHYLAQDNSIMGFIWRSLLYTETVYAIGVKCYIWNVVLYGDETWTHGKVDQKHLESFEMWCWRRMEKISWTDRVRNEEVLHRVKEERNILTTIKRRKAYLVTFCVGTASKTCY
jgi:hypothetical protein